MQTNSVVDFINSALKKNYGVNDYGDPKFRVVFSDDQTERRKGKFKDYHSKIILIREVEEVREVQVYPYIKKKWIIERWAPGELAHHKDLVTTKNGVYVCVYVFQDKDMNYLPPLLKVAEIIIKNLLHPRSRSEALSQDRIIETKLDEKEVDAIELDLKIQSDEVRTKDPKSLKETASEGYTGKEEGVKKVHNSLFDLMK